MASGDILRSYGAKTTITITLTSLANGSARESTVIDLTAVKPDDLIIRIQTTGQASGTSTLDIYAYAALADTTYADSATGSDAAFTAANRLNAKFVDAVKMNATTAVKSILRSLAAAFGGVLPDKVGFIFVNSSGAALSATAGNHVIEYEAVYWNVSP